MNEGMIDMLYNFDREAGSDHEYLYCLRIILHEPEPTLQGVQRMLHELYAQRRIKPEMLLMAPQDIENMSRRVVEEHMNRSPYIGHYFIGKLADREMYPPFYGREIKQIENTYIYPLESLEHRVVIAGFMPIVIG